MAAKLNAKKDKKAKAAASDKVIGRDSFVSLVRFMAGKQGKIDELAGQMGGEIAKAVETKNLHKGAFALARRLDKMDAAKLRLMLLHFDRYREHLQLDKRAAEQVDFIADEEEAKEAKPTNGKSRSRKKKIGIGAAEGGDAHLEKMRSIDEQVADAEKRGEDTTGLRDRLLEEANRATLN